MHDGVCRKSSKSGGNEETPSCALDLAECLPALCSFSSAFKTLNPIFVLFRKEFDPRTFAVHVVLEADCHKVTNSASKRCPAKAELGSDSICGDRVVL